MSIQCMGLLTPFGNKGLHNGEHIVVVCLMIHGRGSRDYQPSNASTIMCCKSLAVDSLSPGVLIALTILHAVAYVSRRVVQLAPT